MGINDLEQSITLNLPYDLSPDDWKKVSAVYQQMEGWIDCSGHPCWFGTEKDERYIVASVEPSGLVLTGHISDMIWIGWITVLCAKLTLALGREIHDADS